jgi:hypothetical protein
LEAAHGVSEKGGGVVTVLTARRVVAWTFVCSARRPVASPAGVQRAPCARGIKVVSWM